MGQNTKENAPNFFVHFDLAISSKPLQFIYGCVHIFCLVRLSKKCYATSKQGRRLRFGILTVLTNISGGRPPSMEDDLRWKTTFSGRRTSVEDTLRWKTTFGERRPSVEDNLLWETTYGGRKPLVETTFGGTRPSVDPCMLPTPLCGI